MTLAAFLDPRVYDLVRWIMIRAISAVHAAATVPVEDVAWIAIASAIEAHEYKRPPYARQWAQLSEADRHQWVSVAFAAWNTWEGGRRQMADGAKVPAWATMDPQNRVILMRNFYGAPTHTLRPRTRRAKRGRAQ